MRSKYWKQLILNYQRIIQPAEPILYGVIDRNSHYDNYGLLLIVIVPKRLIKPTLIEQFEYQ